MKKTKTIYWISTIIFAGIMLFSSIPDIMCGTDAITFMKDQLGYPLYFIPFIGVAKLMGCIAILIPTGPRLKEWAYAGLFFDLIGAIYSQIAFARFSPTIFFMLIFIAPGVVSYVYFHKLSREKMNISLQ